VRELKFSYIQQHNETGCLTESVLTLQQVEELTVGVLYKGHTLVARRQFTGILDKNSKEIYEGDVLSDDESFCTVTWQPKYAGFYCDFGDDIQDMVDAYVWSTVVGNIYENPELLTPKA